jgi:general secretion pathway protein D
MLLLAAALSLSPLLYAQDEEAPLEEEEVAEEDLQAEELAEEEEPLEEEEVAEEEEARPPAPGRPSRTVRSAIRPTPVPSSRSSVRRSTSSSRAPGVRKTGGLSGGFGETEGESSGAPVTVTETGMRFDFNATGLFEVIAKVTALTGRNFDIDPAIADTPVTIITNREIPKEMAFEVLESILSTRGFAIVPTLNEYLWKILPSDQVSGGEKTPLRFGEDMLEGGFDDLITHVITLKYADAADMATIFKILGSKMAQVDIYASTNTLIITDTSDGLRRMFAFLETADVPGFDTVMEIFTLEFARAESLAQQIEQVLLDTGQPGAAASRTVASRTTSSTRRPPTRSSRNVPGSSTPQVIGSREETLRLVPDERLNAIIVVATEGMMERVRDLVGRLDTPIPPTSNNLHIYELLNADVEKMEEALKPLLSQSSRGTRSTGSTASKAGGSSGGAVGDVQPFEQKVHISRYDQTNALLIVASPQDYKVLEGFIAELDVPQRQVLVEAVVMDVTMSNDYGVIVDAAKITGHEGFAMTSTSALAETTASMGEVAGAASGIVGGPAALGVLGAGTAGGLTAGIYDDVTMSISGYSFSVPFVPLLFKAIETVSDLEVLSQPSVVSADNEEASVVVGQEVPFITNTSNLSNQQGGTGGSSIGSYGGYTRVNREEVGVKLTVTPQISEGDNVLLEIEIEVSDVASQGVGDVNILGPTTNKSLIKNKVLVKDGQTAVLAGLIRDTADRTQNQSPVLGDLPVIGFLFRNKTNNQKKRNMVVLVTPHIVKESIDMERLTIDRVNEYQDQNVEQLLDEGFFKKVSKKAKRRKNYRPTSERSQSLTGRRGKSGFRRGDIKR